MYNQQKTGAVIVAAGESRRMGDIDKVFASLGGKTMLQRVVDVFQQCDLIDQIVIVLSEANLERGQKMAAEQGWSKVTDVCQGGRLRQDSVKAGLSRLNECLWVLIHDGARPLVTEELIRRGLEVARETGAAVPAFQVTDTIKTTEDGETVRDTPPRQSLWAVQTPQVFRYDIITEAYRQVQVEVTDDASLVEKMGYQVKLYPGSYDNIKVTTPEDLALAQVLWRKRGK